MFVKIIRGDYESLYECDQFHTQPGKSTEQFEIVVERSSWASPTITLEIDKTVPERLEVYVMNSLGQTVERMFIKAADKPVLVG
jgi:hypothetical protein